MNSSFYADIRIKSGATIGEGGISTLPVATRLFAVLHGIFHRHPKKFALGLPLMTEGEHRHPGHIFRFFFALEEDWRIVFSELDNHERIGAQIFLPKNPVRVPENFDGPWVEYRRLRIPGRKSSMIRGDNPGNIKPPVVREKRLDLAENCPFFVTKSKSTGQVFSLHIVREITTRKVSGFPDGFGLSTPSNSFSLPMVAC